jgi:DNA-binding response OmpR family regulator
MSPLDASVRQAWSSKDQNRGGPGILVADDDAETRQTVCEALNHQGFTRVFQAADGAGCLAMYRQHADAIRVLVLDVMMPNLSGAHVLESLLQIKPQTLGVLLLSGHADSLEAVSEKYRRAGGQLYIDTLAKPFRIPELASRIKKLLLAQGGPSALVGQGVLNTPTEPSPARPESPKGKTPQPASFAVDEAFRGTSPGLTPGDLSRLEKQLAVVESQVAQTVNAISGFRRLIDEITRARR